MELKKVLVCFGLNPSTWEGKEFGSGYINNTFLLTDRVSGKNLLFQRINHFVFRDPNAIAGNMRIAADYLAATHPDYLFLNAIKTREGSELWYDEEEYPWRILPFIGNSYSIDEVAETGQAYAAARQFAILTRNLAGLDASMLKPTIPDFHNLAPRYRQFRDELITARSEQRRVGKESSRTCIIRCPPYH